MVLLILSVNRKRNIKRQLTLLLLWLQVSNQKIRLPNTKIRGNDPDNPEYSNMKYQTNSRAPSCSLKLCHIYKARYYSVIFSFGFAKSYESYYSVRSSASSFTTGTSFIIRINAVKLFSSCS